MSEPGDGKEKNGVSQPDTTFNPDDLISDLKNKREKAQMGGGIEATQKQHSKGKMTARERIDKLLDDGTFVEQNAFMTHRHDDFGLDEKRVPGDSVVTGFGKVHGRMVCVYAQDFTVMGGSFSEVQGQKVSKLYDLALDSGVPIVALMDSVGARIQEGVYSMAAFSELFYRNTQASGVVPQISVMMGPCAGGSVYAPALTDFIVMTEDISYMFITGPKVIEAVTGEQVDKDTLGGAKVHAGISGVAHFTAEDEEKALALTRKLLAYLPSNNAEPAPAVSPQDDPWRNLDMLNSAIPADAAEAYDMRDVLRVVFDQGSFLEVQAEFAKNAVIGLARLHGQVVGLIANQPQYLAGVIDIDASDKMARFIRFCDAFNIPLVSFVDTPGFLPGVKQEYGGVIRHGAKVIYAYAEATVPKMTVITRKAYGGAYIVMSSKYLRTDLVFAWPSAEIAVMGAEGAMNILYPHQTAGEREQAESLQAYKEKFMSPYEAAKSGQVDDVIMPAETRSRLIAGLELLKDKRSSIPNRKHGNMPL